MKDYDPEKMISDSRFTVLFADSDKAMQEKVLSRIDGLVSDNRPYADDKNYGFLCNLFTSLAFVFSYEERGRTREESIAIVRNAMYDFVKPQIKYDEKAVTAACVRAVSESVYANKDPQNSRLRLEHRATAGTEEHIFHDNPRLYF